MCVALPLLILIMEQPRRGDEKAAAAAEVKEEEEEIKWTDDRIRWVEDADKNDNNEDEDESEECAFIDPFKDPNPQDTFSFQFEASNTNSDNSDAENTTIDIDIQGYKKDADQVWKSTGLTLWRASEHLCHYLVKHAEILQGNNKRILEVRSVLVPTGPQRHRSKYWFMVSAGCSLFLCLPYCVCLIVTFGFFSY